MVDVSSQGVTCVRLRVALVHLRAAVLRLLVVRLISIHQCFFAGLLHCPWPRCCVRCQRSVQDNWRHQVPWYRCVQLHQQVACVIRYVGTGAYCTSAVTGFRGHQIPWYRWVLH